MQYFSPEENQLFSNVRICLSQISRADSKSLWAMITLQGGKCQLRLDRYCTHLITGKASGIKYETATRHHIPTVTPDWVTECCKKGILISEVEYHPRLLLSANSSTAMITGFMDEDTDNNIAQEEQDRTKAMLEQLKQRMPWNQPVSSPPVSSSTTHSLGATSTATVSYSTNGQNTVNIQQQQLPRSVPSSSLGASANVPSVSDQNVNINQANWLPQPSQQSNVSQQIKAISSQMQQQELSQQQMNMQHQLIQQPPLTSPQQQPLTQQLAQHQQQLQQPSYNQQQILNQQLSPQVQQQQQLIGQQQTLIPQQQQQQINSQLPQHQLTAQQQQLLTSQQKQLNQQHQIIQQQQISQQQLPTQQSHLTPQQQQVQLATQQQQQIVMQQQQQLPSQQQQIATPHQLTQQQAPSQQLAAEQRQLILLQQQQQQQKIQQISQQLQQSAPQSSQFVVRDGQLQQQSQNQQQLIGPNQQGFIVKREWQQQQYHLQLQRQQQIGPLRSETQWNQLPRHLIQLDKQTHLQLQQMDPQQRAQFIQKLQKQRNLLLQRQVHNRQQGPHIAVIRSPGKPQSTSLQWIPQVQQPQMMGPQLAPTPGQKPVHSGVQPPALTPINSSNQVIVPTGQAVQGPQVSQTGQTFQQAQLTPQQLVQLQMQKQQQMARLQQLHLQQQQQQQQGAQQETSLTSLSNNAHIPPDQQLVVNAKTKTALANMLTNRLQGGATEGSAAGQLRLMTAQHRPPPPPSQDPQLLAAYQRRTLGNITNGAPTGIPIKMQYPPVMPQPKPQFYGHNPNLKCMCLFFILLFYFYIKIIIKTELIRKDIKIVYNSI